MSQLDVEDLDAPTCWAGIDRPVWVCSGAIKEPRKSWSRKQLRENSLGNVYVRARTRDGARETARRCGLRGWSTARYITVRMAHPVRDLGMVRRG